MRSAFVCVHLLLCSAVAQELVSDKESLKKSLRQVDKFLKAVGQRIDTERTYLQTIGRTSSVPPTQPTPADAVTIDGVSNEDYARLWFGNHKFDDTPQYTNSRKEQSHLYNFKGNHTNFDKAIATLDERKFNKGTTRKISNAVKNLKGLLKTDLGVKTKRIPSKLSLRQIREKLKSANKASKVKKTNKYAKKTKRENDEAGDEFDVFGSMEFPEESNLPGHITTVEIPATGGGSPPEILEDGFMEQEQLSGPGLADVTTLATTTEHPELLLDPNEFGYTTSRKPMTVFGDVNSPPRIQHKYLMTTPAPHPYVSALKAEMSKYDQGVFSMAVMKFLHQLVWKDKAEGRRLAVGLGHIIGQMYKLGRFDSFQDTTKTALLDVSYTLHGMPYDEMRSYAIILLNGMQHRRQLFSSDINKLLDYIDGLYDRREGHELLRSLQPVEAYRDPGEMPYMILYDLGNSILAPWSRIKDAPRGAILRETLKEEIKKRFPKYKDLDLIEKTPPPLVRRALIDIPDEFIANFKPSVAPPRATFSNPASENIYPIDARRDDVKQNIYNSNLQSIFSNFMRTRNIEQTTQTTQNIQTTQNWNTAYAKPLFNRQLKSTLIKSIVNKNVDANQVTKIDNENMIDKNDVRPVKQADNVNITDVKPVTQVENKEVTKAFSNASVKPSNPLRIRLNARPAAGKPNKNQITIITNSNQARKGLINQPRALFRSGDSYVDFNMMAVNNSEQFQVDMFPDGPPMDELPPNELNFQIEGDNLNLQLDGDKKLIVINKDDKDRFGEDRDAKSSSSTKTKRKHHKKHHKKHKRTHSHHRLKNKLAKIKKIVKMFRAGHKKYKHKYHHHNRHKISSRNEEEPARSIPPSPLLPFMSMPFNMNGSQPDRFQMKGPAANPPVRNNFMKSLRRQMMIKGAKKVDLMKLESVESDEEIDLRRKVYGAMALGPKVVGRRDTRQARARMRLRDSSASDEEANLKDKIYAYFNNIQPE